MRARFSEAVAELADRFPELVFLTGDLGFRSFEILAHQMGPRFVNTGVAEQTAVGIAAGLASRGHKVIWYSIAPFAVYRPLEQIRLDICLHRLPVLIVGNGGGYGYGIMGATHHCLEDLACLSCLPSMVCSIPAFQEDLPTLLESLLTSSSPAYLRLGQGEGRTSLPSIESVQVFRTGMALTVLALGPMLHNVLPAAPEGVAVLSATSIPFDSSQERLWESLRSSRRLLVVEEHGIRGGLGEYVAALILSQGIGLERFRICAAQGYPNGLYGSQDYHRRLSGLDISGLSQVMDEMLS